MWRRSLTFSGLVLAVPFLVSLVAGAMPGTVRAGVEGAGSWLASDAPWPCYRGDPVTAAGDTPRTAFAALLALKYGANCGSGCVQQDPAAPRACDAKYVFEGLVEPADGFAAGKVRFRLRFQRPGDPAGTWRQASPSFELTPLAAAPRAGTAPAFPTPPAGERRPRSGSKACTFAAAEPAGSPLGVVRCFTGEGSDAGFGAGWHSPLQRRLEPDWLRVRAVRGDGSSLSYRYTQKGWHSADAGAPRLRAWNGGWRFDLGGGDYEYYDAGGSLVADVAGDGRTTVYQRDAEGMLQAVIGPRGRRIHVLHDAKRRIVALADPLGSSCTYTYGAAGTLAQVHCDGRPLTAYRYGPGAGGTTEVTLHHGTSPQRPVVRGSVPVAAADGYSRR